MNQAGGFREKNEDIACLCLKKERFTSSLRLQIVTIFATNSDEYSAFFFNFPYQQSSQKAVSTAISPRGTVVDLYAAQTHTDHVTDWENSLKQIGL